MDIAIIGSRSAAVALEDVLRGLEAAGVRLADISGIISGGAAGADSIAPAFAEVLSVPFVCVRPDYARFGKRAPIIRNKKIVESAGFVLVFWDMSAGTASALEFAKRARVPFFIVSAAAASAPQQARLF